jgi:DNA-binding GntR family transcriptional regulator
MGAHRTIGVTNYDMLRDAIREDIVAGIFPPGSRLKVSDLTERYNISAIPIRDALQQLCGEGFVAIEPNRGARVREIDAKFLNQIYEIRRAVESYFVQRLAERVTRADIAGLRRTVQRHAAALSRQDNGMVHDLDWEFHRQIVAATQNEEALSVLARHYKMIRPLRVRFGRSSERSLVLVAEHETIVAAIEAQDGARAAALLEQHIDRSLQDLIRLVLAGRKAAAS